MLEILLLVGLITLIFIITALPLYFAVKVARGKTTLGKTILINIIAGLIVGLVHWILPVFGTVLALLVLLGLYAYFFRVGFLRALLIWFLEIILVVLFGLLATLLGAGIIAGSFLL